VIRNHAPVAGYGTAFEGTILLRIRDGDSRGLDAGRQQRGDRGVQGGSRVPAQTEPASGGSRAFEESASGSGEDLHLFRVPIIFG